MNTIDKLAKAIVDTPKVQEDKKTSAYDATAKVVRIEGSTAWVNIPGGVDETPAKMVVNAKQGEEVRVHVAGGKAYVTGNATSPPTDDSLAKRAESNAIMAQNAADKASAQAEVADKASREAVADAKVANESATTAKKSAESAVKDAQTAYQAAQSAQASADAAQDSADEAQASADTANEAATNALIGLSTVENVVDVLEWITAHGHMNPTTDTEIDPAHVYFVVDPNGDYVVGTTHYSVVTEPDASQLSNYYQLNIDEGVSNYVATHIVVDSEGLWIIPDNSNGNRVLIATGAGSVYTTAGTYIIGTDGTAVAMFATNGARIGKANDTNINISSQSMTFTNYTHGVSRQAFKISANDVVIDSGLYTDNVVFRAWSEINAYAWYVPSSYPPDPSVSNAGLYVEAFSGTADAENITSIVHFYKALTSDINYLYISRSDASAHNLISSSTTEELKPLYIRYTYRKKGISDRCFIGNGDFDDNDVFGISTGGNTVPTFEITSKGAFIHKNSYPIIHNPVSRQEVLNADSTLTTSSSDTQWLTALLKAICIAYPSQESTRFIGCLAPNSAGYYEVYIYDTSVINENGLPQYSLGTYRKYSNISENFGTNSYTFYLQTTNTAAGVGALPVSGGTITGNLTIDTTGNYASVELYTKSSGQSSHYGGYLRMYSQGEATPYGMNGVLETGGGLFIGSGESPANHYSEVGATYKGEDTFVTSDGNIRLQCNGNTITDRRGVCIWQSGANTIVSPCKQDLLFNGANSSATNGYYFLGADSYRWYGIYTHNIWSNNGTIRAFSATTVNGLGVGGVSGDWWGKIPTVQQNNGVMEIGKYIDFHETDTTTADYTARLYCNSSGSLVASAAIGASNYYVGSHNSPIGTIIDAYLESNKSLSANTFTMLTSVSLPVGVWVCTCGVRFAAGGTGGRVCNLEASSGNGAYNIAQVIPTTTAITNFMFTKVIETSSTQTYYLNAMSSVATTVISGGTNYGTFIRAVRIK